MKQILKTLLSVAFIALLTLSLSAQTNYVFDGSLGANWTDSGSWSPSYPGLTVAAGNTIAINSTVFLNNGDAANISCDVTIAGGMRIFSGGSYNQLAGTVTLNAGALWQGPVATVASGATFANNGEVRLWGHSPSNIAGSVIINGSFAADQFTSNGNGVTSNISGDITGSSGGWNGVNSGGATTFSGSMSPGEGTIGCLSFMPSVQTSASVTNIEANGTVPCSDHDRINGVNGVDFAPAGTLNFTVGYTPADGDVVHFFFGTNSMITGTYDSVNAPAGWSIAYNSPSNGNISMVYDASAGGGTATSCEIDQPNSLPEPSNSHPTLTRFGQSFMGSCPDAGVFQSLEFTRSRETANGQAPERTATLNIYSGNSNAAGDLVYSQAITIPAAAAGEDYYLINIPIGGGTGDASYAPGQTYTWEIESVGLVRVSSANNNPLTDGNAYWGGTQRSVDDFKFKMTVSGGAAAPVPTMGEWALITFGLIVMSMAVVTIRRRESIIITAEA